MYNLTLICVRVKIGVVVKGNSITYSECVIVAFGIQHAMRVRHIDNCGLSGSTIFFHTPNKNGTVFGKK
jgi:hypothetical protein